MRFPRIHRIRWDKPAAEADTLETVQKLVVGAEPVASEPAAASPFPSGAVAADSWRRYNSDQ
jgi:hypothetical protein